MGCELRLYVVCVSHSMNGISTAAHKQITNSGRIFAEPTFNKFLCVPNPVHIRLMTMTSEVLYLIALGSLSKLLSHTLTVYLSIYVAPDPSFIL